MGVEDEGTIAGVRREGLERWVMDAVFGRKVHPMILPFYEEVQVDGRRRVAVISVTQGTAKPYVVRHKEREDIYVRVGSTSRLATREQQARLFALGGMLHAELLPVSGSGFADLSRERLEDYLTRIVGDDETPGSDGTWGERLCGLGFMAEWEGGGAGLHHRGVVAVRTPAATSAAPGGRALDGVRGPRQDVSGARRPRC